MQRNRTWISEHTGPLSVRDMSSVLGVMEKQLDGLEQQLALTRIARNYSPFAVLVACLISLRTKDEVTDVVAPRLLSVASTPAALAALSEPRIEKLIYPAGFYRNKAKTLRTVATILEGQHAGSVPDTLEGLLELPGVGRKTANLVITLGYGKPGICVDTHVHRISNRLGFVVTNQADDTEQVLRARLARRWWIPINDVLVAFGRTLCGPLSPRCSECAVSERCPKIGVARSR